ncbi:hypothetical protein AURDEDRAFT_161416 [Auricularia subglabra TFB-10046 SS5]|nr:hypothetical protein AURDEDRAFT_161416 [Auricularia subglabra TFB-10046 SS5]
MARADVRALELHAVLAAPFFAAFAGVALPRTRALKIFVTRMRDAAGVLQRLLALLPARAAGGGVHFPALDTLELDWKEDERVGRLSITADQALLLAAALGIPVSPARVSLELRWIDVSGGSRGAFRLFEDVFDYGTGA